jgi:Rrf2 family protein
LSKVLQALGRAGLVRSRRGLGGGFELTRSAEKITVYDVVQAVDPVQRIRTCPLGLAAHGVRLCPLHKRLDDAMRMVEEAFRKSTLAEVLAEPSSSKPLCNFPEGKVGR